MKKRQKKVAFKVIRIKAVRNPELELEHRRRFTAEIALRRIIDLEWGCGEEGPAKFGLGLASYIAEGALEAMKSYRT